MNDFIVNLLASMLLLGIIQIFFAIAHMDSTCYEAVRRHYGYYFVGVGIYVILTIFLFVLASQYRSFDFIAYLHFFGSAFGLALYHAGIVCASIWLKFRPISATEQKELEGVC